MWNLKFWSTFISEPCDITCSDTTCTFADSDIPVTLTSTQVHEIYFFFFVVTEMMTTSCAAVISILAVSGQQQQQQEPEVQSTLCY